ncbi:protoglobin domain-containing protein [Oceanithermus sp.]
MGAVTGSDAVERRLRRVGFGPEHAERLLELKPIMHPLAHEMALAFYDHLGQDPETRRILWGEPGRVERLYESFEGWYRELFEGVYDADYAAKRLRVGMVHARYGVPLSSLIPAIGQVYSLALEHLLVALRPVELPSALEALGKVLTLDTTLMAESYERAVAAGVEGGEQATRRGAARILTLARSGAGLGSGR